MIRRLFYLSLGAFLALWVVRRLQALQPDHVARRTADRATGMLRQVRDFTHDVLGEAAERETELRARFGLGNSENHS
ncbi:hypothetical protein SAMN05421874_10457 [Nonomuraea maritima]|uniref:Uncharacterized protein n=1 Tax=Nonomuraea maritima TaxID=683260 RepID=A0A1G8XMF1_9ACTN|nr:hypothetical protein [Nonomuraea maritima]SDJ91586.1 hypothetical protein SAMN05421874_10457 [Nonomuraea maritima]